MKEKIRFYDMASWAYYAVTITFLTIVIDLMFFEIQNITRNNLSIYIMFVFGFMILFFISFILANTFTILDILTKDKVNKNEFRK